jgi:hypothetical protein
VRENTRTESIINVDDSTPGAQEFSIVSKAANPKLALSHTGGRRSLASHQSAHNGWQGALHRPRSRLRLPDYIDLVEQAVDARHPDIVNPFGPCQPLKSKPPLQRRADSVPRSRQRQTVHPRRPESSMMISRAGSKYWASGYISHGPGCAGGMGNQGSPRRSTTAPRWMRSEQGFSPRKPPRAHPYASCGDQPCKGRAPAWKGRHREGGSDGQASSGVGRHHHILKD